MDSIMIEMRNLNLLMRRVLEQNMPDLGDERLFRTQAMVLGYLKEHGEGDVLQRDLEDVFEIRRSTATKLLQRMEEGGWIVRAPCSEDARKKRISVTPKAEGMMKWGLNHMEESHRKIEEGITDEEKKVVLAVFEKMKKNILSLTMQKQS